MSDYEYWSESNKLISLFKHTSGWSSSVSCASGSTPLNTAVQSLHRRPRGSVRRHSAESSAARSWYRLHLVQLQYKPLMSVLTKNDNKHMEKLGHIAACLDHWPGVTSDFGNLVDPQLPKLAVFDTKFHPNGRKTTLHSALDLEMLSMGFEPIAKTDGFRHEDGPCTACCSRVEPCVVSRLRRLKNGQIKRGPCTFCRVQRVRCSYVQGS